MKKGKERLEDIKVPNINFEGSRARQNDKEQQEMKQQKNDRNLSIIIIIFIVSITSMYLVCQSEVRVAKESCNKNYSENYCMENL